jgi:hypothetical protein
MGSFDDQSGVVELLKKAQSVESDRRDKVREVHLFLDDDDGQWDDHATKAFKGRPRYTLDKCNDLVDDIAGPIEQKDFDIQILPAGGDATKELAKTYDGLIRNIQNLSNATDIYQDASRDNIRAGFDCWRVNQRWGDNNTFDQDLYIDEISDAVDRVWFDPTSVKQTREDSGYAFVLQSMGRSAYEEKFPKGSRISVGSNAISRSSNALETIVVGELLYKTKVERGIVELTNGSVYVEDGNYQKIKDELAKQGATVARQRSRMFDEVKTRIFDGGDWLTEVQDTVFELIPLVPIYANWSIREGEARYWGIVTKKLDAQRIYNYTESRKVEEGALAPLEKIVATSEQVGAHKSAWERLNVSADPVLPYEHQDGQPPPYKIGGAQINPGLESTSASMLTNLQSTAGIDQLNGQPLGLQSGLAVELKQDKGDTRNLKYTRSLQTAICHTGKILTKAIPKVYDAKRQVTIIGEDQTRETVTINDSQIDEQTGERVEIIDLSKGLYDVTCAVSPSFKNRQSETVTAMTEMAAIDPQILETGRDVFYKSMNAPGFELIAEREREKMLLSGQIPQEQMTDEEIAFLDAQPDPEPDPVEVALQREADNADDEVELKGIEAARKDKELQFKIDQDERKQASESMDAAINQMQELAKELKTQTETLQIMRESGAESLIAKQEAVVRDSQAEQV